MIDRNITFCEDMARNTKDKAFFVDLMPFEPSVVIDFGAGCGNLSVEMASRWPSAEIVVVEQDRGRSDYARHALRGTNATFPKMEDGFGPGAIAATVGDCERSLVVFSSVLHEVNRPMEFLGRVLSETPASVAVRDMGRPRTLSDVGLTAPDGLEAAVSRVVHRTQNEGFVRHVLETLKYGCPRQTGLTAGIAAELAMKALWPHADEFDEDYFALSPEEVLAAAVRHDRRVAHFSTYQVEYVAAEIQRRFDATLTGTTHFEGLFMSTAAPLPSTPPHRDPSS